MLVLMWRSAASQHQRRSVVVMSSSPGFEGVLTLDRPRRSSFGVQKVSIVRDRRCTSLPLALSVAHARQIHRQRETLTESTGFTEGRALHRGTRRHLQV